MSLERKNSKKKILLLCPSPKGTAAAQRLKYEQYLIGLEEEGYSFTISPFQTRRFWKIIYKEGRIPEKMFWIFVGYLKRTFDLLRAPFYDGVFVTIWVTPLGLPVFERLLLFFNKNVIYDIDDMLFLSKVEHARNRLLEMIKGKKKPIVLMKNSRYVIVCTPKLEEIALGLNKSKNVVDISSTFDTDRFTPVNSYSKNEVTSIGWTGTHSTIPFLQMLVPVFQEVNRLRKIKLIVIADKEYQMPGVTTEFIPWSEVTEVKDLHRFEMGVYPIPANEWSLGKSSLKALTYMAVGIPAIATAYGTNFRVIEHGVSGFLAKDDEEWVKYLVQLIDDVDLRKRVGLAGRKRVVNLFSVKANFPKYLKVFKTVFSTNE